MFAMVAVTSIVTGPRPAFCCLQYGKAGEMIYHVSDVERNLVMYGLAHEKKITGLPQIYNYNPLFTRFNFTEFMHPSIHSQRIQHVKGKENK